MTLPHLVPVPAGPYEPTTELVARAWLALAVPYVRVGDTLPPVDDVFKRAGFVRIVVVGGDRNRDVPLYRPVVRAECWVAPPAAGSTATPWNAALRLAGWVERATDDRALMGVKVELAAFGNYKPARVRTVNAIGVPQRVQDPGGYARIDVDLNFNWTGV